MEILARIPTLAVAAPVAAPPADAAPAPALIEDPSPRRRASSPRRSKPFPAGSIAVLALIAGAAWAAAVWHDRVRALRQQPPARWAEAFDGDPAPAGGVVR